MNEIHNCSSESQTSGWENDRGDLVRIKSFLAQNNILSYEKI
jgi:hypothetical protein